MYTIKIKTERDGILIVGSPKMVEVHTPGDNVYDSMISDDTGMPTPKLIICYYTNEDGKQHVSLYGDDRAWIMNANGKTVASI